MVGFGGGFCLLRGMEFSSSLALSTIVPLLEELFIVCSGLGVTSGGGLFFGGPGAGLAYLIKLMIIIVLFCF